MNKLYIHKFTFLLNLTSYCNGKSFQIARSKGGEHFKKCLNYSGWFLKDIENFIHSSFEILMKLFQLPSPPWTGNAGPVRSQQLALIFNPMLLTDLYDNILEDHLNSCI